MLETQLKKAGFTFSSGKGSHRKYFHPEGGIVVISGRPGNDARQYQLKMVQDAIEMVRK